MQKNRKKREGSTLRKFVYWVARLLAIAGILFISMFALDVFGLDKPWTEIALALFMHLLPSFVLIAILVIAWRIEWLGGILFVLVGLSPFVVLANPKWVNMMLGGPFVLAGILFLASHRMRPKEGERR